MEDLASIAKDMIAVARANPFRQTPENPICPEICGRGIRMADGVYDVVFSYNIFNIHGQDLRAYQLSVSRQDRQPPNNDTVIQILVAFNLPGATMEITKKLPPEIAAFQRQFVKLLPPEEADAGNQ